MKNEIIEALKTLGFEIIEHHDNGSTLAQIKIHGHYLKLGAMNEISILGLLFETAIDIGERTAAKNYERGYKDGKNHKRKL